MRVALPLFFRVIDCESVFPIVTVPKLTLDGVAEIWAPAAIVIVNVAFPVPVLFVALNVTVELPVALGVPEMAPLVVLTLNPAGKPVAL